MAEYIERKRLEEAFDNADPDVCESDMDGYSAWGFGRENVRDVIRGVPAEDVAPVVHGCFEPCFDENGNWRQGFAKCSNCGKEYYAQVINHFGFCPNCGAKMDGGGEDG